MILPIVAFGNPILRLKAQEINQNYDNLDILIENMWETMYNAKGVGLAAPQIGKSIRVFIVDASPFAEDEGLELSERKKSFYFVGFTQYDRSRKIVFFGANDEKWCHYRSR